MDDTNIRDPLTGRAAAIRDAARTLLERDGPEGLAMRPLAESVGVHPPAVYRHFSDKRAVERAVVTQAYYELGDALETAADGGDALTATTGAYRAWAGQHPHLFRLVFGRNPDPDVDRGAVAHAERAMGRIAGGDEIAARALWASVHGLVILELDGRLPAGPKLDAIWTWELAALRSQLAAAS
jgi:AcrR family transcriptional regulator